MKKKLYSLFILSTSFLPSCSRPSNLTTFDVPLFHLEDPTLTVEKTTTYLTEKLDTDTLNFFLEKKATFLLMVYASGCGSCTLWDYSIWDYIRVNNAHLTYIDYNDYEKSDNAITLSENNVLFYKEGILIEIVEITEKNNLSEDFNNLINQYYKETNVYLANSLSKTNTDVSLPSYTIETTLLDESKENTSTSLYKAISNQKKVLYLNMDTCSDLSVLTQLSSSLTDYLYYYKSSEEETNFESITGFDKSDSSLLTFTLIDYSHEKTDASFKKTSAILSFD